MTSLNDYELLAWSNLGIIPFLARFDGMVSSNENDSSRSTETRLLCRRSLPKKDKK